MKLDPCAFESKLKRFPRNYLKQFNEFWDRKLSIESEGLYILHKASREETCEKLDEILKKWQYFRGSKNAKPHEALRDSLEKISYAYEQIRRYPLLQFSNIPHEPLESIWHELGRIKEEDGNKRSDGKYTIVSVSKPLMLIWGQTPAFDSRVRKNIREYSWRWTFEEWRRIMCEFQKALKESPEFVEICKKKSIEWYKSYSSIPYGRFIDIYFWSSKN